MSKLLDKAFPPMTPAERKAHEAARKEQNKPPISWAEYAVTGLVFAALNLLAYAVSAGWLA